MKFKQSKLFLFYSEAYRRQFAISHTMFLLAPIVLLFILGELVWWAALFFFLLNIILFFIIRREYPAFLELKDKCVSFNEYNNLGSTNGVSVIITLSDIRRIEYSQSSFEKLFNIGRIMIVGNASYKVKSGKLGNKTYPLSRSYIFYGVRNYSSAKELFSKTFPDSIQKEI